MGISHITRAEFARLAIGGELDPHTQEHLSFCPSCRQQFESLQQGAKSGGEHLTDAEVTFFADREQDLDSEGSSESQVVAVDVREEHVLGCPQCLARIQGLRELLDEDLEEPVPIAVVKRAKGIVRRHPATSLGRLLARLFSGGVSFSFEPTLALENLGLSLADAEASLVRRRCLADETVEPPQAADAWEGIGNELRRLAERAHELTERASQLGRVPHELSAVGDSLEGAGDAVRELAERARSAARRREVARAIELGDTGVVVWIAGKRVADGLHLEVWVLGPDETPLANVPVSFTSTTSTESTTCRTGQNGQASLLLPPGEATLEFDVRGRWSVEVELPSATS
jgi:hypothetical protein